MQQSDPKKSLSNANFLWSAKWTPTAPLTRKLINPHNTRNKHSHELQKLQEYEIRVGKSEKSIDF